MIETGKADRRVSIFRLLAAGALVAVLDGAFAVAIYVYVLRACSTAQLMQSIASAVLGRASFRGGGATAGLGLALHTAVAYGWTLVYAALRAESRRLRELTTTRGGAIVAGAGFGAFVWLAMDLLVVPLTRANPTPVRSPLFAVLLVWHAIGVGLPIALIVRGRVWRREASSSWSWWRRESNPSERREGIR